MLDKNGFQHVIILVGAGAQSTAEAIALAKEAAECGGDHVVVLPPSYYASTLTPDAIKEYYIEVSRLECPPFFDE